ncbi:hypothetical protein CF597_18690 [Pseudomonas sp. PSB1]|nr:hypothetical protein [Pseudomonas sp. PSB1]
MECRAPLWRGSLLPLDCAAVPFFGAASRPSGSKLPRHGFGVREPITPPIFSSGVPESHWRCLRSA